MRKLTLIHCFFVIITAAVFYVNPYGPNLVWNMFLALLAVDFAYFSHFKRKNKVFNKLLSVISVLGWFIFYPNTFYMLTDIVYFSWASHILSQHTALIHFAIFVSSILLALSSGIVSVRIIMERFNISIVYLRYLFILGLSLVSSIAIHIGRYARLNSWDVLLRPELVLTEIRAVFKPESFWFIAIFTFFQIMTLVLLDKEDF